jgi:hypothetical protein
VVVDALTARYHVLRTVRCWRLVRRHSLHIRRSCRPSPHC